jgi:hypothetical protein
MRLKYLNRYEWGSLRRDHNAALCGWWLENQLKEQVSHAPVHCI